MVLECLEHTCTVNIIADEVRDNEKTIWFDSIRQIPSLENKASWYITNGIILIL